MMRLQRWENGPYFADFSLPIPDMRSFLHVREIVKICPRSPIVSIKPMFRYRTPNSLLKFAYKAVSQAVFWRASVRKALIHWNMQLAYRRPARFVEFQQTVRCAIAKRWESEDRF